jgi:hypothetical protein
MHSEKSGLTSECCIKAVASAPGAVNCFIELIDPMAGV